MIVGFIGDIGEYLGSLAKQHDPDARFIDGTFPELTNFTYYTSLGDLGSYLKLIQILEKTDVIYYCPPGTWSDHITYDMYSMRQTTEKCLEYISLCSNKKIHGFVLPERSYVSKDYNKYTSLSDYRKTDNCQIWIAGCSISHGIGVESHQRYGDIIGSSLGKLVSWLTQPSSSIMWASDQIIRSDIRSGDIVCWGITSFPRFVFFDQNVKHITVTYYKEHPEFNSTLSIDRLDDENQIYQALLSIHRAKSYVEKIGAKLLLMPVICDRYVAEILTNFKDTIFPYYENDFYLDLGSDNSHPGPLQHRLFAALFLKKLGEL